MFTEAFFVHVCAVVSRNQKRKIRLFYFLNCCLQYSHQLNRDNRDFLFSFSTFCTKNIYVGGHDATRIWSDLHRKSLHRNTHVVKSIFPTKRICVYKLWCWYVCNAALKWSVKNKLLLVLLLQLDVLLNGFYLSAVLSRYITTTRRLRMHNTWSVFPGSTRPRNDCWTGRGGHYIETSTFCTSTRLCGIFICIRFEHDTIVGITMCQCVLIVFMLQYSA